MLSCPIVPLYPRHDSRGVMKNRPQGQAIQTRRRSLRAATRFRTGAFAIHRRERSRRRPEAQEPQHERSGVAAAGGVDRLAGAGRSGQGEAGPEGLHQAGSGGVGTLAIQLAKHLGAAVATTTSRKNIELVKSLGVDVVIDYKHQDFETLLSGYDLVLNSQDRSARQISRVLKPGGQLISISGPPDPEFAEKPT